MPFFFPFFPRDQPSPFLRLFFCELSTGESPSICAKTQYHPLPKQKLRKEGREDCNSLLFFLCFNFWLSLDRARLTMAKKRGSSPDSPVVDGGRPLRCCRRGSSWDRSGSRGGVRRQNRRGNRRRQRAGMRRRRRSVIVTKSTREAGSRRGQLRAVAPGFGRRHHHPTSRGCGVLLLLRIDGCGRERGRRRGSGRGGGRSAKLGDGAG